MKIIKGTFMPFKNTSNIPLSLAVWLANDDYDYDPDPMVVSVTSLLKPVRSIVLGMRMPKGDNPDISDVIQSSMGQAIHSDIERAWTNRRKREVALLNLGYPRKIIEKMVVNPGDTDLIPAGAYPVYLEKRTKRKLGKWTLSGKFDFVAEGKLRDFKSTGTYNYINQGNATKYMQQGSMYKWLNPAIIINDHMAIDYVFTDWSAIKAKSDKAYPQARVLSQDFLMMTLEETEHFIQTRLNQIDRFMDAPQEHLPKCQGEELWQSKTTWKYYKNPAKKSRSTKNFYSAAEASLRLSADGNVGVIDVIPGEVKFCRYCNAVSVCTQAEGFIAQGLLKI